MKLDGSVFDIDCENISQQIEQQFRDYLAGANLDGVVVGMSGGIDSAVATALAVRALGKEKVVGFILPSATLDQSYEDDAREHAKQLGIKVHKISIAQLMTAFSESVDEGLLEDKVAFGNAMARFRMVILYAYANFWHYLVVGTSNKSEIMVGYITKYGDGGVDFEPCGELYKTHIRLLAKYLDVPEAIITKPPSAGLWDGQTDEGELGITYELLDLILFGKEKGLTNEELIEQLTIEPTQIELVEKLVAKSAHKRKMPPVFSIEF